MFKRPRGSEHGQALDHAHDAQEPQGAEDAQRAQHTRGEGLARDPGDEGEDPTSVAVKGKGLVLGADEHPGEHHDDGVQQVQPAFGAPQVEVAAAAEDFQPGHNLEAEEELGTARRSEAPKGLCLGPLGLRYAVLQPCLKA